MSISQESIDEIRQYPDVLKIFQAYVSLKKRGKHYLGLCPFHSEKTPSFNVNIEKKMFYCFGCQASGDHISFVQQIENLSFPEAIEEIASLLGIMITKDESKHSMLNSNSLAVIEALSKAQDVFHHALDLSQAKSYLNERGVCDSIIDVFSLGFAKKEACKQLVANGVSKKALQDAGLLIDNTSDLYGRFSGRLMFPIANHTGKILGFGGRIIEGQAKAKYLNSPESDHFQKSHLLYGLHLAKKHIKKTKRCILVEGYMDVIGMHQIGFQETVAVMGTALGLKQAHLLKRFTDTVYLFFDSDHAGQEALKKSYLVLKPLGFYIYAVSLNSGDPADLCLSNQGELIKQSLDAAKPFLQWLCECQSLQKDLNIEEKSKLISSLKPYFLMEKDLLILQHYKDLLAQILNVSKNLIRFDRGVVVYNKNNVPKIVKDKYQKAEQLLVVAAISSIALRSKLKQQHESFQLENTIYKQIYDQIIDSDKTNLEVIQELSTQDLKRVASELLNRDALSRNGEISNEEFLDCIGVLKEKKAQVRLVELKELLSRENASEKQQSDWLMELQELSKERGMNA